MSFSVLHPNTLQETEFDKVVIATHTGFNEVVAQLAAQGIAPHKNEHFCFVSLDTDLHDPILSGLEFFYPRMVNGGVILVDDYFSTYDGVKKAVDSFAAKMRILAMPIGDNGGVILVKGG